MKNTVKHQNPVVDKVIKRFETVEVMTSLFLDTDSRMRGLMVLGDPGMGKTYYVTKALKDSGKFENVRYIKGADMSAPAFFAELYYYRNAGDIIVLDDVDIVNKGKGERSTMLALLKGATDPDPRHRTLEWLKAGTNQLFKDNNIPSTFEFHGTIIWITNDTQDALQKSVGNAHWNAISSRFRQVPAWFDANEKIMYTLYLIEECDILGKNCLVEPFTKDVIEDVCQYLRENWEDMEDVTPRVCIDLADLRNKLPDTWTIYANTLNG